MYMWNLKNRINNNNKSGNKLTDTENILRATRWEGSWRDGKNAEGIKMYKCVVSEYTCRCRV